MSQPRTAILLATCTLTATVCSPAAVESQFSEAENVIPIRPLQVLDEATAREIALHIALDLDLPPKGIESGLYDATKSLVNADPVNGRFFKLRSMPPLGQDGLLTERGWSEMCASCKPQLAAVEDAELTQAGKHVVKFRLFGMVVENYYDWMGANNSCQENLAAAVMQEPRRNIRQKCEEVSERFLKANQFLQKDAQTYLYRLLKAGHKTQESFWDIYLFSLRQPGEKPESAILDTIEQLTGKSHRSAKRYRQAMKIKLAP